jgi:hypothetical protein
MNAPFPFGLPIPTALYLGLYLLTLAIHFVLVSYVVIGTTWVVVCSFQSRSTESAQLRIADVVRDWLSFALGTAITAGVAPLLFVQVLYMQHFYTANLLLFHRWMAIVPVLIAAFSLLYLLKRPRLPRAARVAVPCLALLCFLFVALSWTENHLLSLDSTSWPQLYESKAMRYAHPLIPLRLAMWIAAAIPVFCTLVGWQSLVMQRRGMRVSPREQKTIPLIAMIGIASACLFAARYLAATGFTLHGLLWGPFTGMHVMLGMFGVVLQVIAWIVLLRRTSMNAIALTAASIGVLFSLMAALVCRELIRLGSLDLDAVNQRIAHVSTHGGSIAFAVSFVISGLLIAWCIRTALRRSEPEAPAPGSSELNCE